MVVSCVFYVLFFEPSQSESSSSAMVTARASRMRLSVSGTPVRRSPPQCEPAFRVANKRTVNRFSTDRVRDKGSKFEYPSWYSTCILDNGDDMIICCSTRRLASCMSLRLMNVQVDNTSTRLLLRME